MEESPKSPEEKELPAPDEQTPKSGRKLNWKGFIIALLIVGILDWGAVTMLKSESKQVPPPKPTPSPTMTIPQSSPPIAISVLPSNTPVITDELTPAPTRQPIDTGNWQLFHDKYFSSKIPTGWIRQNNTDSVYFATIDNKYSLSFQITNDTYSLDDVNGVAIVLNRQPAKRFTVAAGQGGDDTYCNPSVQSNYKGKRYNIWVSTKAITENCEEAERILDGIISTFKFLN
jgi:hypothetical protein